GIINQLINVAKYEDFDVGHNTLLAFYKIHGSYSENKYDRSNKQCDHNQSLVKCSCRSRNNEYKYST
ncbi:unnamed protein product, partial [Rotaria magnacalcarata]